MTDDRPRLGTVADLFQRRYGDMVRVATLLVDSEAVAEELVQDAFVRVQKRWDAIDGEPDGYLYRAVVNACRSHHRRRYVEKAFRPDPVEPDRIPEPDGIYPHLDRLSHRRRTAIVMRFYADEPDEVIAEVLECKEATVRSLIHRGLKQLREVVES